MIDARARRPASTSATRAEVSAHVFLHHPCNFVFREPYNFLADRDGLLFASGELVAQPRADFFRSYGLLNFEYERRNCLKPRSLPLNARLKLDADPCRRCIHLNPERLLVVGSLNSDSHIITLRIPSR